MSVENDGAAVTAAAPEGVPVSVSRVRDRVIRFVNVIGWEDAVCAFAAGVLTVALHVLFAYPGIHPEHWGASALACLTRPPDSPVICLWLAFGKFCSLFLNVDRELLVMRLLGHVSAGILSGAAYYFLRFTFAGRLNLIPEELSPCVNRLRILSLVGTVVFACSDFVWRQGQFFTADLLHVLLAALAVMCFLASVKTWRLTWFGFAYMFAGVLSAETPIGVLLALCFFVTNVTIRVRNLAPVRTELIKTESESGEGDGKVIEVFDDEIMRESQHESSSLENWSFCVFYFMSLFITLILDAWLFHALGGMEVKRLGAWDYPMILVSSWLASVSGSLSLDDFLAASTLTLLPFAISFILLPLATNAKSQLAFPVGSLLMVLGLGAETQLGPWSHLWYWAWNWREMKASAGAAQTLLAFFSAGAVTAALLVICCASRRRKLGVDTLIISESPLHRRLRSFGAWGLVFLSLLLVYTSVNGRRLPLLRERIRAMVEYVRLQADHAAGLKWLFTDGSFDDAMRVEFKRRGEAVQPVSVMSEHQSYDTYLRSRTAQDVEDIPMLEAGGAEALRFWVNEKPAHLAASAAQIGFRTLNKTKVKENRPRSAGTAMRVVRSPQDAADYAAFDRRTRAFSQEVLELAKRRPGIVGEYDRVAGEKFDFMLWRLARMSDQRARFCSIAGDAEGVRMDNEIGSGLDSANRSLKELAGCLERLRPTEGVVLTPREGLHIALRRADFELARRYAEMVMRVDADDEQAHFAMAMWSLEMHDYKRASRHFDRALRRNPNDPALLNNAALAYMKSGYYREALDYAESALRLMPTAEATKRLIADIRKKMSESSSERK